MTDRPPRDWAAAGLGGPQALAALQSLPGAELTSALLELFDRRARARTPADVLRQYERDTFTPPAALDLRLLLRAELRLLDAAAGFEAIELSPLAPLATSSAVAPTSQNRVVSSIRGTEVVSDSTNVMALECARRLRRDRERPVRLVTCQRVVRAQEIPKLPGYAHHFKLFALATAGLEQRDHAFVVAALLEQIRAVVSGLRALAADGFRLAVAAVRVLATPERAGLADRIAAALAGEVEVVRGPLTHRYYAGLRYQVDVAGPDGAVLPLADGGAFDWVARLTANRRHVFVASGLGSQLLALVFKPDAT